jgi:23S rRNA (uridine2552-2'-O)-methyltransferase
VKQVYTEDYYQKQAQKLGLRARSYFKLQEIDEKYHVLKGKKKILDLGAAPGSWTQYCLQHSKQSHIFAVDLQKIADFGDPRVTCLQEDVFKLKPEAYGQFDLILSDMAPKTMGIRHVDADSSLGLCEMAFFLSQSLLAKDGHLVMKLLQGSDIQELSLEMRKTFTKFTQLRPKSTRKNSSETFLIGLSRKSI